MVVGDEPDLRVERDILGEMPRSVVGFGSEPWPHLVDALEHPDHHLLVELRALREIWLALTLAI